MVVPNVVSFNGFLIELSSAMLEKRMDVHCACSLDGLWGSGEKLIDTPVQMHGLPCARGMNPVAHVKTSLQLNSLVSSIRPDIVHAHFSSAILTTALARRRHWPVTIGTFQGVSFLLMRGARKRFLKMAETWASSRLDKVWVLTEDDRVELSMAAPGAKIKKQQSCGFGCDLDRFNPTRILPEERDALLSQLGLTPDHHIFAFIGRQVHFKGFDTTVRAFLRLGQADPDARLLLIGARDALHHTGLTRDEESALRSSSQIIDLGWQSEVQKYLAITRAVVFPSKREGMPVCLMEALAMGVPVITCDSRGCRDVVRDQVDGIVLKECTVDNLVSAMELLIENKDLHSRLVVNALAGRERFNRLNYVREQIQIYEQLSSPLTAL